MALCGWWGRGSRGEEEGASEDPARESGEEELDEAPPEDEPAPGWRERAETVLPTGASTGSKRAAALYGSAGAFGPTHFVQAGGCRVVDTDGESYVDCGMALGAVAIGYAEPAITRAAIEAAAAGNVSLLSNVREVELAERLRGWIPCAEKAQFLKSGAEAVAAAVRIARAYTGREAVVGCGYFGWLDWASDAAGVPRGTRGDFTAVAFDDVAALDAACDAAGDRLAAIVLEPVIERLPSAEWIARARERSEKAGAVLVFDEIKTGFRLRPGGYQEFAELVPDLAVFGKAMANGFPLGAVVGRADVMDAARSTWISSTLASEATALAAALAVLDWHEKADVCGSLWSIGAELKSVVEAAIEASGMDGVRVDGLDPMWLIRFPDAALERRFLEGAARHGVLFKRGAYNYAALAHDDEAVRLVEAGASAAFVDILEGGEEDDA